MLKRSLLSIFFLSSVSTVFAQPVRGESLCKSDEISAFSCQVKNKWASLCVGKDKDYAYYAYGTKDKIEFKYPENLTNSLQKFYYQDVTHSNSPNDQGFAIRFNNGAYQYVLFRIAYKIKDFQASYERGINVSKNDKTIQIQECNPDSFSTRINNFELFAENNKNLPDLYPKELDQKPKYAPDVPNALKQFIEPDTRAVVLSKLDLSDQQDAYFMMLEKLPKLKYDELGWAKTRIMLVLMKNKKNEWYVAERNEDVFPCPTCGNTRFGYDLIRAPEISKDQFHFYFEGGGTSPWNEEWFFRLNPKTNEWYVSQFETTDGPKISDDYIESAKLTYPENMKYTRLTDFTADYEDIIK